MCIGAGIRTQDILKFGTFPVGHAGLGRLAVYQPACRAHPAGGRRDLPASFYCFIDAGSKFHARRLRTQPLGRPTGRDRTSNGLNIADFREKLHVLRIRAEKVSRSDKAS
jgi:hypothetical protein